MQYINTALIVSLAMFACLSACKHKGEPQVIINDLNTNNEEAVGPYLTQDQNGNQVLCWTERNSKDSLHVLKYARYNPSSKSFGSTVTVPASRGMNASAESMGKIAFKKNGTVFAVFAKSFKGERNPFAGAIYYCISNDDGATWSKQQFLHSDTSHHYGRGFFDITRLRNGELAAIWLDGRLGKSIKGSSLFCASTEKSTGFKNEHSIAKGTCECCRTDIMTDNDGNLHIAYRSILFPDALLGQQVRDMVYSISKDNGKTFSEPKPISKDNWRIEGCPHSGPTLAISGASVSAVWFTARGTSGLYHTFSKGGDSGFNPRTLLSSAGRHPQSVTLDNEKIAVICEEVAENHSGHSKSSSAAVHNTMGGHHPAAADAKITLSFLDNTGHIKSQSLTDGKQADHHAVITKVDGGLLAAWVREKNSRAGICYSFIAVEK